MTALLYPRHRTRGRGRAYNSWLFSHTDVGDQLEQTQHRIEILQDPTLTQEQRQAILDYTYGELGKSYMHLGSSHDILTYALGIPSRRLGYEKVSFHGLAFLAYAQAGYQFRHQLQNVTFFNHGKYIGHSLFDATSTPTLIVCIFGITICMLIRA